MIRHRTTRLAVLTTALGMLAARQPVRAESATLGALPARTPLAVGDLLPVSPAGGAALMKTTAGAVRDFVLTSVKAFGAVGDGVADDTAALQAALDSGQSLYCPPGTYKITATLNVTHPYNDGQTIKGSGAWGQPDAFNTSTPPSACVIKPTSAVTKAFLIDGTAFPGGGYFASWVQGFGIEDIVFDLTNMTDDASHIAINQIQAWDVHYERVRVSHDGSYKRGLLLTGGAFTSTVNQFHANIIDMEGIDVTHEVTTITITNPDVAKIIANYTGSVTVIGGAAQFPYAAGVTPVVWIPAGVGPYGGVDSNATGTYLAIGTDIKNSQYFTIVGTDFEGYSQPTTNCALSGWAYGTYNDGSHGCHKLILANLIEATSYGTTVQSTQYSGDYWMDQGVGSSFPNMIQSGGYTFGVSNGVQYDRGDRRVIGTLAGVSGWAGPIGTETATPWNIVGSTGVASFRESILRPSSDGIALYVANAAGAGISYVDTSGNGTLYLKGSANLGAAAITPASDGSMFFLKNAAGNNFMICASNASLGSSNCGVGAGADWKGFSDTSFSVQTYDFDASTGNGTFTGTVTGAAFAGPHNGTVGATTPNTGSFTTLSASGAVSGSGFSTYLASPPAIGGTAQSTIKGTTLTATTGMVTPYVTTTATTFSGLPGSPVAGMRAFITDDNSACTLGTIATGSGSTKCPVVYNGSSWIAG